MGTVGVGGPTDVAGRIFAKETGTQFQIVPYRGGAPLAEDLLGGHIDFAFGQAASTLSLRAERRTQGLCGAAAQALVGGAQRADAGRTRLPRHRRQFLARHLGAEGTPTDVIDKLNAAIRTAWRIPPSRSDSRKSARKSGRPNIRRLTRWRRSRRRKSPAGRRSSRKPASRPNDNHGRARPTRTDRNRQAGTTLARLQLERLKKTLQQAYERVPHYKKKFDAAGVHPADLKELADLAKFPFTTKDDLRQNYPFGMFAVPMDDIVRIHASSGTTGKPTVVGYTKNDIDTWSLLMARSIRAARRPLHRQDSRRLRLWPVHRRPRRALRRRVSGRGRDPGRRRLHRAAGAAHPRFPARHHHGDAVLYAGDRRRVRAPGT